MFRFVTALFRRPARRRPAPTVRLHLDALEQREVPTTVPLNWAVVGPKPIPQTWPAYTGPRVLDVSLVGYTNPCFRPVGWIDPEIRPVGYINTDWWRP